MSSDTNTYDVIVVGGGAAGMMAAAVSSALGKRVLILEKNSRLGKKLSITGGGRCNILNAEDVEKDLLTHYADSEQFLYSSFAKFGMRDTYAFFESHGLPLKVEARKRAFPSSEKASDVVQMLNKRLVAGKVEIQLNSPVTKVNHKDGHIISIETKGVAYSGTSYVFATGGFSHPETGSTGDGFSWLSGLGHTFHPPTPTIVPLKAREPWVKDLAGVSAPSAKMTFFVDGKKSFSVTGPILFTHVGVSGPTILNSSGKVADLLQEGEVTMAIDLFPTVDLGNLDKALAELFNENKNKTLRNVFRAFVPPGMNNALLAMLPDIDAEIKVHSVTKEHRRQLVTLVKSLTLSITGLLGFDKAVVADGGVPLTEVDMRTLRSKKVDNLFIIGDLLHITRPSGGYSLQLCWTTGYVAGTHA